MFAAAAASASPIQFAGATSEELDKLSAAILLVGNKTDGSCGRSSRRPVLDKRWNSLKCYGSKHTASWGYLEGIYQRIDNACDTMIGRGEYKWLEKGQEASFHPTIGVAPSSQATHATVSFMAHKGGTPLHKTQCREILRYVQDVCATSTTTGKAGGPRFTYGGSVRTDDGNISTVIAFFPECCF
ncbi:hypothetical protein FN846DRAFT_910278 [Sphaerosporella brunnea]|uniref:Uncharacterized protein n=1 Tax=Sphaerosporella brunnea TaxID=1250544 RepID=A0A5J5EM36_9PEZI|nr:hypothetical protein FN846DRAFT_910278 [Sphaerosporella brunnea]